MDTGLALEFADGEYFFQLKLPQIIELQQKCAYRDRQGSVINKGVLKIYQDVMAGRAVLDDGGHIGSPFEGEAGITEIQEIVRLALIGGNQKIVNDETGEVSALDAKRLVENYLQVLPVKDQWDLAASIIHGAVVGYTPKKKAAVKADKTD